MYKETKVEKESTYYPKYLKSIKIKKNEPKKQHSLELTVHQILEKQELFLELLGHIYQKLQDLDKKYESTINTDRNSQDFTKSKTSTNQVIFDAINITKNQSNISIRLGLDIDTEIIVNGVELLQVLSGILQNSILFTKEGQIKIETFVVKDHNLAIIRICDTGEKFKDVPSESSEFSENKSATNSRFETMDFINYRKIISSFGGNLEIKNNNLIGVTFTISLPIN